MDVYGIKLIGINAHTGEKLLFTFLLFALFIVDRMALKAVTQLIFTRPNSNDSAFGRAKGSTSRRR